jgi:hypothetical protein
MVLRVQWTTWQLQEETDVSDSQPDIQALPKGMEVEARLGESPRRQHLVMGWASSTARRR